MRARVRRRRRDENGAIAVVAAVLSLSLFVLASLVVDLGNARDVRREAQAAADASALAAANELYLNGGIVPRTAQAFAAAKTYAAANYGVTAAEWSSCTDPVHLPYLFDSSVPCISFDQAAQPTTVRVKLPVKKVGTPFASLIGVRTVDVAAKAHASLTLRQKPRCGLCVLGTGTHDLQNGDISVTNGDLYANGSVNAGSNGVVTSTGGTISVQGTASGSHYSPAPATGQPLVADPLIRLPLPPDMSSLPAGAKSNPCTQGPGYYGAVTVNGPCPLSAGLYVISGSAAIWSVGGGGNISGTGVTLYFTCGTQTAPASCASGATGATLATSGGGMVTTSAPTTGPLAGLALVADRNNNATFSFTGNGTLGSIGTVYLPAATLELKGNGCTDLAALVVIKDVSMAGNPACLKTSYDANQNFSPAPTDMHLTQ